MPGLDTSRSAAETLAVPRARARKLRRKQSERTRHPQPLLQNRVVVGSTVFVILGLAALAVVGFVSRASDATLKLAMPFGGSIELTSTKRLAVTMKQATSFDSTDYVISSDLGFVYRKPKSLDAWSSVHLYDGLPTEQLKYVACVANRPLDGLRSLVSRTLTQTTGEPLGVTITERTSVEVYGTKVLSGVKRPCNLPFRNGISVEVFPKNRLKQDVKTNLSLPAFVSYAIAVLGIQLDKLAANPSQILGTWTWRVHRARLKGKEDDFTEYRAFSFTQTESNFYVAEIAFSPQTNSPPDRWLEMQNMLESFRLITEPANRA
jgi:hypothetical protein